MRSDIRWIRNRVSSLVDNLTDRRDAAVNTTPPTTHSASYTSCDTVSYGNVVSK